MVFQKVFVDGCFPIQHCNFYLNRLQTSSLKSSSRGPTWDAAVQDVGILEWNMESAGEGPPSFDSGLAAAGGGRRVVLALVGVGAGARRQQQQQEEAEQQQQQQEQQE